jgi:ATP-dependent helicase HepA
MGSSQIPRLSPGDKVQHSHNRELGPGEVQSVTANRVTVHFPKTGDTLMFALANHPFVPLQMQPGADPRKWAEDYQEDMVERLARLQTEGVAAFRNRLDALELMRIRESAGFGSFLGGRVELFPHQLHVARNATHVQPVRWLLADEVGLGKTVEACLILNHLVHTARTESVLVIAPRTLTVQWLGELYRKFHQVFVLLDADRRHDVARERGADFNPFHVYRRSVVALEDLVEDASLARAALEAPADLLVVDEAHRLRRRRGTDGSPSYRVVAPLCGACENVLLLSATPIEADAHGFYRLLELLHPREYTSWEEFETDLNEGKPIHPCTTSTRRIDIGGLPPRVPRPVQLPAFEDQERGEEDILQRPADNAVQMRERIDTLERFLETPQGEEDPRILWLREQARKWRRRKEKALIFVGQRDSLTFLKRQLERETTERIAVFHEDLSPQQRDLEVARFADPEGPNLLIATEAGGEGRNFQFARRLVLFDLPWDPILVEQRIGRLDRINRRLPVEIVYFLPASGLGRQITALYEGLGIFQEPLGGLDRALGHVVQAIRKAAESTHPQLDIEAIVQETHDVRQRVMKSMYHHLLQNAFRPELGPKILDELPPDLEERTEAVVLGACEQFGFEIEEKTGKATWYLEFGGEAVVEGLHGVSEGSRFLGTFDRAEAVAKETLEFFASGHPLVEGILGELADGTRGQVALLEFPDSGMKGEGWLLIDRHAPHHTLRAFDLEGNERLEWSEYCVQPEHLARVIQARNWKVPDWGERTRAFFASITLSGKLNAVAAVRFS